MKAKEFEIKKRDPNWRSMQDIRRSGAGGQHKDKKKAAKQGEVKHKGKDVTEGYTTEKQIMTRIRQIMHDRKLSGTESNAGELYRLKQQLKDMRSQQGLSEGSNRPDIKAKYLYNGDFLVTVDGQQYSFTVVNMERDFKNPELIKKAYINEPDGRSRLKPEYDDAKYYLFYIAEHLMQDVKGKEPSDDIQQAVAEYIDEYHQRDLAKVDDFHKKRHQKDPDFYHVTHQLPKPQSVSDFANKDKDKDVEEDSDWGEPREILEGVLQTLEREVEWPLTELMDLREVKQLLAPIVKAVNDKLLSMDRDGD